MKNETRSEIIFFWLSYVDLDKFELFALSSPRHSLRNIPLFV